VAAAAVAVGVGADRAEEDSMAGQTPETEEAPVEELLVEEVSIDGMCGVY
jgi:mycofactocin precursor